MALADVQKFFEDERDTVEDFKNTLIQDRIDDAQDSGNSFEEVTWSAWSDYCESIIKHNWHMARFPEPVLCKSLADENTALEYVINYLAGLIRGGTAPLGTKRHLDFIRSSLCLTHATNRRILSELTCTDSDNTNPDCRRIRLAAVEERVDDKCKRKKRKEKKEKKERNSYLRPTTKQAT